MIEAIIFDLDGVLIDSEGLWDAARRKLALQSGGQWSEQATTDMLGMSTPEWSAYMHDVLGVQLDAEEIARRVTEEVVTRLQRELPLLPGARDAVRRLAAAGLRLGLASSASRRAIEVFLDKSALRELFAATISSEEVRAGKPAPDVYLAALAALHARPAEAAAVEDSANGIRSAAAAGLKLIAIPNRAFPPPADVLSLATVVLGSLHELGPGTIRALEDTPRSAGAHAS
jgi:HAD superfamily hydrolase (TIGR01509 family)